MLSLVLLLTLWGPQGRIAGTPPAQTLDVASERNLGVPLFRFYDLVQSDEDGNLFFHIGDSLNDPSILKIRPDGSRKSYAAPPELPRDAAFHRFYVTRSGEVYTLIAASNGAELYCVPYKADGSPRKVLKLPLEGQVSDTEFAVFENGNILVGGFFRGPAAYQGKRFRYLLNSGGELLRRLETATDNVDLANAFKSLQPGGMVEGYDGNLYTLAGIGGGRFEVHTIAPDGEVKRRFGFKVEEDFTPLQLFTDPLHLVAVSHKRRKNALNAVELLVINAMTGEIAGRYTPSAKAGNVLVHFSTKEGFKFLNSRDGVYWVFTVPLR